MKIGRGYFKGLMSGVLMTVVVTSLMIPVFAQAGLKTIDVFFDDIKLYVDGKLVKPTDGDGNEVMPFIYDGTTYLPVKTISNALSNYEKEVSWDGETSSIYIGKAPVAAQTDMAELERFDSKDFLVIQSGIDLEIELLDKKIIPFNKMRGRSNERSGYTHYILDSKYSKLKGFFAVEYYEVGSRREGSIQFYNVSSKGEKTLIREYEAEAGDDPIAVDVDLRGVNILLVEFERIYEHNNSGSFYDVVIEGVK